MERTSRHDVRRTGTAAALTTLLVAALMLVPGHDHAQATSPGKNGRIYFEQSGDIYSVLPSGLKKKRVIPGSRFPDVPEAIPSPDGRKVAFTSNRGGSDIWIKDLTTGAYKNVTERASDKLTLTSLESPAWSPDGTRLVFQATREQRSRLFRIDVDGTRIKQLMYFEDLVSGDLSPDWSSRNLIVFAYRGELWTMKPDGSGLTQATVEDPDFDRGFDRPTWSPDGTKIAAEYDGTSFAGGGIIVVTPQPAPGKPRYTYLTGDAEVAHSEVIDDPSWSPDGKWIVYYGHWAAGSAQMDDYDLWKIKVADPETPVDLNARDQFGADVYHPNWSRLPG